MKDNKSKDKTTQKGLDGKGIKNIADLKEASKPKFADETYTTAPYAKVNTVFGIPVVLHGMLLKTGDFGEYVILNAEISKGVTASIKDADGNVTDVDVQAGGKVNLTSGASVVLDIAKKFADDMKANGVAGKFVQKPSKTKGHQPYIDFVDVNE